MDWLTLIFSFLFNFEPVFCQTFRLFIHLRRLIYMFSKTSHMAPHIYWFFNHTNRVQPWTVKQSSFISWWDHWSSASFESEIGTGFYNLLSGFAILCTPHIPKFHMATFGNAQSNNKTTSISLYFRLSTLGKPGFASALFLAGYTPASQHHVVTRGRRNLFHILTSFVLIGPISMLTNRLCHGPWAVDELHSQFPNQTWPPADWSIGQKNIGINSSKLQSDILLHKRIRIYTCGQCKF